MEAKGIMALFPSLTSTGNVATMDSREIAELTNKRHYDVCKDIENQIGKLDGGVRRFAHTYVNDQNGQAYLCYQLPYRETMIIISGYSVGLRAKVIDRWIELESKDNQVPTDFPSALRLAADQAEQIQKQQEQLALTAPKAEAFDNFHRSDKEMSITDAAKHFGYRRQETFDILRTKGYLTVRSLPTARAIDENCLIIREVVYSHDTEGKPKYHSQAVVHAKQLENFRQVLVKYLGNREITA